MFFVSLIKIVAGGKFTVMCNGALIGERDILTVGICAHEIAVSEDLDKYAVRVAEGIDVFYECRLKRIIAVTAPVQARHKRYFVHGSSGATIFNPNTYQDFEKYWLATFTTTEEARIAPIFSHV